MEGQEELVVTNDQASQMVMIKRKRTKRQRPLSPNGVVVATAAVTSSSSSACGGDHEYNFYGNTNSFSSPTTSGDIIYESTEEEEDMANCLILLAQGDHVSNNNQKQIIEDRSNGRRISDFSQNSSIGKAGLDDYECKTCSRTFSSFQALGGHRASHKKPKSTTSPDEKVSKSSKSPALDVIKASIFDDFEDQTKQFIKYKTSPTSPPTIPIHIGAKSKIHECSICGSEFTSGQALGGHMRRHRTAAAAANNSTSNVNGASNKLQRNVFSLDLNLPAPEDQDLHHHSKFQFVPTQQTSLVFNALVDCHY